MLTSKKKLVESILSPVIQPLAKINPNILTLLGSIPPLLFFVFVIKGWYWLALLAFCGSVIDMFDGMVARSTKRVTVFGGFLDSTLDRVSDFFIITAFAFGNLASWGIIAPLLLCAYLTSYIRSRGELANRNVSFAVGLVERTERLLLLAFALLMYTLTSEIMIWEFNSAEIVLIITLLLSLFTVLQRVIFAYKHL